MSEEEQKGNQTLSDDDSFIFAEESHEPAAEQTSDEQAGAFWKVMIIDDEPDIHKVTKMALTDVTYEGKPIKFISAYSCEEAKKLISENPDTALILLDVVMEERDSGLKFVKFLREDLKEKMMRIILRTGQPGQAPQGRVILDYDINDYKEKSELTRERFFSSVIVALRSFRLLEELNRSRKIIFEQAEAAKRFVPYSFLEILQKESILDLRLGDFLEKEIVVLFLDVRSFTTLSKSLSPVKTYEFVNEFISYFQPSIIEHGGFIDKYVGDAIMALFETPPDKAIKASLGMIESLKRYNEIRQQNSLEPIRIGIGINQGVVALGTVGFHDHMDITVISDVVNMAERLEKLNKIYATSILISESVYEGITKKEDFTCRWVGRLFPMNKQGFNVYQVLNCFPKEEIDLILKNQEIFEAGVKKYYEGDSEGCWELMNQVLKENSTDTVASLYQDLCKSSKNLP